jgi:hypothetical protein
MSSASHPPTAGAYTQLADGGQVTLLSQSAPEQSKRRT